MPRFLLAVGVIVVFGVGLAAGSALRDRDSASQPGDDVQTTMTRLRYEISTLQTQIKDKDATIASLRERMRNGRNSLTFRSDPWMDTLEPSASASAGDRSRSRAAPRAERQARESRVAPPPPTVEAATQQFRRYVAETSRGAGPGRWAQTRELLDELRAMGSVGTQALMNVLAGNGNSDE